MINKKLKFKNKYTDIEEDYMQDNKHVISTIGYYKNSSSIIHPWGSAIKEDSLTALQSKSTNPTNIGPKSSIMNVSGREI